MSKYYTMIGSRDTPEDICKIMEALATKLHNQGWTGRSGGADGADTCLEKGTKQFENRKIEIYLPWEGFNGRSAKNSGYIETPRLATYETARKMAEKIHPNWPACSRGARALHTRNIYQILGHNLALPSKFVVCYAMPAGVGKVKGGTATAVSLAHQEGITVTNLWDEEQLNLIKEFLNK